MASPGAFALVLALLSTVTVSAQTECGADLSGRMSTLEARVSRLEDRLYSVLLSQFPGTSDNLTVTLPEVVERLADITRSLETCQPEQEPQAPEPVCESGMADSVSDPFLIMSDPGLGKDIRCDAHTDGGGWIVFQRRVSGDVDFYRTWNEYRDGFGDLAGDFWLGNEALYQLTKDNDYELRIDVRFDGQDFYAHFSTFKVRDESDNYRLELGTYSGDVGDAGGSGMIHSNNGPFSTYDRDNDAYSSLNCAVNFHGAWWYTTCSAVNLNGEWGVTNPRGLRWYNGQEHRYATSSEMKIRRI